MSNAVYTVFSTSLVWIALIVLAVILGPSLINPHPTEIVRVQVTNTTDDTIRAAFFVSNGTTVGSTVPGGEEAEYTLFEGELSNPKAPNSVHVLIAGDGTDLIINMEFEISKSKNGVVTHPISFEINDPKEGETEKQVEFVIWGGTTP